MAGELVKLLPLKGTPGIKRDGTIMEGTYWTDGEWSRFYRGLPRSMGGYTSLSENYNGPSRGMFLNSANGYINITSGYRQGIEVAQFSKTGVGSSPADRTPSGFASNADNLWQIDAAFTTNDTGFTALIAHAGLNLTNIDNNVDTPVYYGDITTTAALTAAGISVSGGICYLNPFVIAYGNNGLVAVSAAEDPTDWELAAQFNICSDKIVKAIPIRGGAYAPSALLWSLGSLLRMSFVGGDTVWQFDTLSDSSSVLSSSAMIEHDGIYYWPGADRFLQYNGVLRELINNVSLDFFYSNLNFAQQQKVFSFKVPHWGEIWWPFPLGTSDECNWALIFNYRENCWYDTPLPIDGRSAGINPTTTFPFPVLGSANGLDSLSTPGEKSFPMWQHEIGTNVVRGSTSKAIRSSITSPSISIIGGGLVLGGVNMPGDNSWTQVVRFEPDFLRNGNLQMQILGRMFPEDNDEIIEADINTDIDDIDKQSRYIRYKIICNVVNNRYVLGQSLIHFRGGDRAP